MRQVRDMIIALSIGVVWAMVVLQVIGYWAASSPGRLPEMEALALGNAGTFLVIALLRDAAIYALPSVLAGYLITRLMDRPMPFALIAGVPAFLFNAYSLVASGPGGPFADGRGVYMALNTVLVLVAIAAGTALVRYATRFFRGAMPQAN